MSAISLPLAQLRTWSSHTVRAVLGAPESYRLNCRHAFFASRTMGC